MSCHSTHYGIAATNLAKAITGLDDAQASSIYHRLKREHATDPSPDQVEVITTLTRIRRDLDTDDRLNDREANRLRERLDKAITEAEQGTVPDGPTWAAFTRTGVEAEVAERHLDTLIRASARHQHTSANRMGAVFRQWRRRDDYEVIEAPDPAFRITDPSLPSDKHTRKALAKMGFENWLAQKKPVFVYGTLRRAQGNDRLMNNAIASRSEEAHVNGVAIYGADRGFPYAQEAPDGVGITRGDLVYLTDDQAGDWARQSLDHLEGFDSDAYTDSHYRRVQIDVTYRDPDTGQMDTVNAWTYLAGGWAREELREEDRIPDGDWVRAKDEYRAARGINQRKAWWEDSATTWEEPGDSIDTSTGPAGGRSPEPSPAEQSAAVFAALGDPEF